MQEFGAYLKQEREARETSLDEVARITRISRRFLIALEEGRTEDLPELTFVRGFLRAYAEAVGLDGSALVLRYETEALGSAARGRSRFDWRRGLAAGIAVLGVAVLVAALLARAPAERPEQAPFEADARPRMPAAPTVRPDAVPPLPPRRAPLSPSPTPPPPAVASDSATAGPSNPLADLVGLAPDDEAGAAVP